MCGYTPYVLVVYWHIEYAYTAHILVVYSHICYSYSGGILAHILSIYCTYTGGILAQSVRIYWQYICTYSTHILVVSMHIEYAYTAHILVVYSHINQAYIDTYTRYHNLTLTLVVICILCQLLLNVIVYYWTLLLICILMGLFSSFKLRIGGGLRAQIQTKSASVALNTYLCRCSFTVNECLTLRPQYVSVQYWTTLSPGVYCIGFRFKTRENNLIQLLVRTHNSRKYALLAYLNHGPGGDLTQAFYRILSLVLDYTLHWSVLHWLSLQNKRKQPYSTTCPYCTLLALTVCQKYLINNTFSVLNVLKSYLITLCMFSIISKEVDKSPNNRTGALNYVQVTFL